MSKELDKARELVKMLEEKEAAGLVELGSLNRGDVFNAGGKNFIVLHNTGPVVGVVSKNLMHEDVEFDSDCNDYGKSDLRHKIENELLPIFNDIFGENNIVSHMVDLRTHDGQKPYEDISCSIRPLTFDEVRDNNDLLLTAEFPDWYWTCTAWSTNDRGYGRSIAVVSPSGSVDYGSCSCVGGVRPFCILKSNIFVSKGEC